MSLYMETTKISSGQTVAEIQRILGEYGASAVMTEYKDKEIVGICFKILFLDKEIPFRLPCRWQPIQKQLARRVKRPKEGTMIEIEERAKRVAWRQILRWVEAQLALVETDMVKVQEVFLPYVQTGLNGQTLYQQLEEKGMNLIGYSGK